MNPRRRCPVGTAVLAAAVCVAALSRPDTPPHIQAQSQSTATSGHPPTATPTPTPQSPAACGLVFEPVAIDPRILGPGLSAAVRFSARYDIGRDPVRRRVAVVVGPIEDPYRTIVGEGLVRLAEALDLEGGSQLGYAPVGAAPAAIAWWSGPDGLAAARRTLAAPPSGPRSADDWLRAVNTAAAALIASPPNVATAILVVGDGSPTAIQVRIDWRPVAARLRDALVQRTIFDLSIERNNMFTLLVADDPAGLFEPIHESTTPAQAANSFARARTRLLGLTGLGWVYRVKLDPYLWTHTGLSAVEGAQAATSGHLGQSGPLDARSASIPVTFTVAPTARLLAGSASVVPLTADRHTFEVRVPGKGWCRAALDFGSLCLQRPNRPVSDCGPYAPSPSKRHVVRLPMALRGD